MQDAGQQDTDQESRAETKARREDDNKITLTDQKRPRLAPPKQVKFLDRIKWQSEQRGRVVLERVDADLYGLSYACLLIPRFSSHFLMGDVAEDLRLWMQQICLSFSWRLDHIMIQREYLEWILSVPPATSPSGCIRTIREQTSRQIFADFPHYKRENLSKDFWAPGFLVLGGSSPLPLELINQHILMTRQQQGIQPRSGE